MSGTTVLYRDFHHENKRKIYLYGGMALRTGGTMIPGLLSLDVVKENKTDINVGMQYAGSRGSRKM